jgi:hypothetical protein
MTGNSRLLDTVILVRYLRGDPAIQQRMATSTPYVSVISQ